MGVATARRAAVVVAVVLAAACTQSADDPGVPPPRAAPAPTAAATAPVPTVQGGQVTVGIPRAPATLHPLVAAQDGVVGTITRPVLAPLWRLRPDGTTEPWLLAGEPVARGGQDGQPFAVTYRIRREAVWSDGEPVDGADVLFTIGQCARLAARPDCAAVDLQASTADERDATVVFDRALGLWPAFLSDLPVLPEHVLRGRDPATAWTRRISVASGPFRFGSWPPGERLVLERNERWWGPPATLDRLEFRFGTGTEPDAAVAAVAGGSSDVVQSSASPAAVDHARADARVRAEVGPGSEWLALDFNLATPLLQDAGIRRALAAAVDRATIVGELIAPLDRRAAALDGPPDGPRSAADQAGYPAFDPRAAARTLDAAGCLPGADGIRVCGGQPMALDLQISAEDWQQPVVAEYLRTHLEAVGVAVEIVSADPGGTRPTAPSEGASDAAAEETSGEAWDLRIAAVPRGGDPVAAARRWECDDPANTQAFCSAEFDALTQRMAQAVDADTRAGAEADAAAVLAQQLPTYPLYTTPALLVRSAAVTGPVLNASPWGPTWNVEEWARTSDAG